jgi:hypothetical protein
MLTTVETLRIGDIEDPDLGFSRIGNVVVDRDRQIFVFELMDKNIRVYSPDGELLRRIGGPGEGPGEFGFAASIGVTGDTLWALESFARRMVLFDRLGTLLSSRRFQGVSVALQGGNMTGWVMPRALRSDGMFTGHMSMISSRRDAEPSGVGVNDTVSVPRVLFDVSGTVVDTLGWDSRPPRETRDMEWVEMGPTRYPVPTPPTTDPLEVLPSDGFWRVTRALATQEEEAAFNVTRLRENGDTVFSRDYRYTPVGYSEATLDTIAWRSARVPGGSYSPVTGPRPTPQGVDINAVHQNLRNRMDFPELQPPVLEGIGGEDGTLWLRREDTGAEHYRWLILAPDGTPRGNLDLPRSWRIRWVSADEFIAVENDELDIPWLLRFRIE